MGGVYVIILHVGACGIILFGPNYYYLAGMRLFHVDVGYACYGIVSEGGAVTQAAPIAAWMIGKTLQEIKPFLLQKKAIVKEIKSY